MSGMWLVNGKVVNEAARNKVWAAFEKRLSRLYREQTNMDIRHQNEADAMDDRITAVRKLQPFTPWVGHTKKTVNEKFVEDGLREQKRQKEANED